MKALEITVKGIVQGVGFRPFIYRLAKKYKVSGSVRNTSGSVIIEAKSDALNMRGFIRAIKKEKPSASEIISIAVKPASIMPRNGVFRIIKSEASDEVKIVPPDIKICGKCAAEMDDPENRRFHYPFINCTDCGPRFTIIKNTPYDRKNTVMAGFRMCPECLKEYNNPDNRRYHAEPNACPKCGPKAWLADSKGRVIEGNNEKVFIRARALLKKGKILAVKGLGGFHIAADACNRRAAGILKKRKRRTGKPFAVMAGSLETVRKHMHTCPYSEELLAGPEAPVVIMEKRADSRIGGIAAEGLKHTGFFLPYAPVHRLLFEKGLESLIMTSANISEEPIQHDNKQAVKALSDVADYFLLHDRDINIPADDSVIKPYADNKSVIIRRSRGYVPAPISVRTGNAQVIGTGALLKNTLCFLKDGSAFMSQHIGDLENRRAYEYFLRTCANFADFYGIKPAAIACDMHPDYMSSSYAAAYAAENKIKLVKVQHHYAHMLSVMAEHGFRKKAIGIIMDGTGYGEDGNTWGGEFLTGDISGYERAGHLKYIRLPGGNLASTEAYRTAISILSGFLDEAAIRSFYGRFDAGGVIKALKTGINTPLSSGAGRLFDAAASMLGICHISGYDSEAPMKLEAAAFGVRPSAVYKYGITNEGGKYVLDFTPAFKSLWKDRRKKHAAANFHHTFTSALAKTASLISKDTGINDIVLSGGVFQNTLVLQALLKKLQKKGFNVLIHEKLSPNDSSIALGQAVYAAHILNAGK